MLCFSMLMMKSFLKKIIPRSVLITFWHRPKAIVASLLYGFPSRKLTCIAVAGTKGKTSTAYFVSQLLDAAQMSNALFTTAAIKIAGSESLNSLKLTTPTPFFLQRFLRQALANKCAYVILEISSHAIVQQRIWGIHFDTVIVTNLIPDHAEYHPTPNDYIDVHKRLLNAHTRHLIINSNDPYSHDLLNTSTSVSPVSSATDSFMQKNILLACAAARALGVPEESIQQTLPILKNAPGRMEYINEEQSYAVIVDYAHSPTSLEAFFKTIAKPNSHKIIVVFGGCGERDATQRPAMGHVLERYANRVIITNDDPYSENPNIIAQGIMRGFSKYFLNNITVQLDRLQAIRTAIFEAQPDDMVCVLGKGAETLQIIGSKKIPWDDRKIARMLIHERLQEQRSEQHRPNEEPKPTP